MTYRIVIGVAVLALMALGFLLGPNDNATQPAQHQKPAPTKSSDDDLKGFKIP